MSSGADLLFHGAESAVSSLGRACWQGSLAILCGWLLCRLLQRSSPRWHCWVWRLVYLKLFIALFVAVPIVLRILPPPSTAQITLMPLIAAPDVGDTVLHPAPVGPPTVDHPLWPFLVLCLCMPGAAWTFAKMVRQGRDIASLRARCRPAEDPGLLAECRTLCQQMKLRRVPQLLLLDNGEAMVHGIASPAILFPEPLMHTLTPDQRRMILAHELAHIKRGDLLWMWLPGLARCLFYFLPPVWLAEREWQQSQELACDEQALRQAAVSGSEYGAMLLQLISMPRAAFSPGMAAILAAESFTSVQRRLLAMKHLTNRPSRSLGAIALLVAVGLAGIVPWSVRAQDNAAADKRKMELAASADTPFSKKLYAALALTEQQQKQMQAIRDDAVRRVGQVLTPEQRQRLLAISDPKRAAMKKVLTDLGLTEAQQRRLQALDTANEERMRALKQDPNLSEVERKLNMEKALKSHEEGFLQTLTQEQKERLRAVQSSADSRPDEIALSPNQEKRAEQIKRRAAEQMAKLEQDNTLSKGDIKIQAELIMQASEEEMRQMLTPEQRQINEKRQRIEKAARADGPFGALAVLQLEGLTPAQQNSLKRIYEDAEQQIQRVLTPEQKARYKEIRGSSDAR